MPAILRKSFTAWEALAALPPTPRINRRPPEERVKASNDAALSMPGASRLSITALASARNRCANVFGVVIFILTLQRAPETRTSPATPPAIQSRKSVRELRKPPVAGALEDQHRAQ